VKLKTIQFSPTDQQVLAITRAELLGRPILGPGLGEVRAKTRMKSRIPAECEENKNDKDCTIEIRVVVWMLID
jgi:hypothetical protein